MLNGTKTFTMQTVTQQDWRGKGFRVYPVTEQEEYEPNKVCLTLIDGNEVMIDLRYQELHETTGEEIFYLPVDFYYDNGWWRE